MAGKRRPKPSDRETPFCGCQHCRGLMISAPVRPGQPESQAEDRPEGKKERGEKT